MPNKPALVEDLERRQASEDVLRWRPSFHLTAPHGWLNDPCGLGYDPLTGKYHLSFQWNPNGNDWGDVSWGHSTSYDFVTWKTSPDPSLTPSTPYDHCGVFTGCMWPTDVNGKQNGTLAYLYTSVNRLPIHYTLPYVPGCESLSIAVSCDGGSSWERFPRNPILPGPPPNLKATSWRDPFVSSQGPSGLQNIQQSVSSTNKTLYGFVSGGIVEQTPTVFVYTIDSNDLTQWKYVGHLLDVGLNFQLSRWSGDSGVNWEVASFVTLKDDGGTPRDFIIMGTEGCIPRDEASRNVQTFARDQRIQRSQLWMCIKRTNSSRCSSQPPSTPLPLTEPLFGGIFDHGCFYAGNSFWDPVTSQQIVFGWITEEDLSDDLRHRQNWSGVISVPRVVKLTTIAKVKRARSSPELGSITSIEATPDGDGQGTYTVRTLGIIPDPRLEGLRMKAHRTQLASMTRLRPLKTQVPDERFDNTHSFLPLNTSRWELDAEIEVGKHCSRVGLAIGHDPGFGHRTILYWDPISETFVIERPHANLPKKGLNTNGSHTSESLNAINHAPEVAPHTLFTFASSAEQNDKPQEQNGTNVVHGEAEDHDTEAEEPLRIRALYDVSVLEVFVNDRTVISTRIYPPDGNLVGATGCYGIRFFAESVRAQDDAVVAEVPAMLRRAFVWDGLEAPGRGIEPKL